MGSPETRASSRLLRRVEIDRHRHIGQAVAGEDLKAGAVREDDQPLLAGWSGAGARWPCDAEFLLRGVVIDRDAPDLQGQDARRSRLELRAELDQLATHASQRVGAGLQLPDNRASRRDRRAFNSSTGCQASRGPSGVV